MGTKEFDVTVGSGIISIFQRQNFRLDRVFSEFIDNSLQSFLDHKELLEKLEDGKKCKVSILWDNEKIVITDNAFGMNEDEFGRALKLKATNPNAMRNNQLSVYGMGLKYASVYLGDHYSITSTAYGSGIRYSADVDVPHFEENNPKFVNANISQDFKEAHETVLTITKLRIKKTPEKENNLRMNLGIIYNHYIHSGDLSISLNNIPIKYQRPELRPNEEGGKYYRQIEDSFTVNGKTFDFTGWIGILNKGDQSITGLNLVQANRCIELGYKPDKLFGKGNSFQNSRMIGEIVFSGDNYVLSFNKDKFVWSDDGAEEAFINKLLANENVIYIKDMAKSLSFTDDKNKVKNKTKKAISDTSILKKADDEPKTVITDSKNDDSSEDKKSNEDNKIQNEITQNTYDKYTVNVNNKDVVLYVDIKQGNSNDDWLKLVKHEDEFLMTVNFQNDYIAKHFKNQSSKSATNTIAILLISSILKAQDAGLKLSESLLLIKTINEIMGKPNE